MQTVSDDERADVALFDPRVGEQRAQGPLGKASGEALAAEAFFGRGEDQASALEVGHVRVGVLVQRDQMLGHRIAGRAAGLVVHAGTLAEHRPLRCHRLEP